MGTKREFVPAVWSINQKRMLSQIKAYYVKALQDAEDKLIEIMRDQVGVTIYGGGPGKPEWRSLIQKEIRRVYKDVAESYIELGVGLPYNEGSWKYVRAMLINLGSGDKSENPDWPARPIQTRPGHQVWNDNLDGLQPSGAESVYLLPDQFNQAGNHFIENAMKMMSKYFQDVLDAAAANMPDSIIYNNITSKKGSR